MTPTPQQQALYANQVMRDCLLEAGDDVEAAMVAAEMILATQPIPDPTDNAALAVTTSTKKEEETETSELFGQPEVGSMSTSTGDTASPKKDMKVGRAKTKTGKKLRRSLTKRRRVKKKWVNSVSLSSTPPHKTS